MLCLLLFLEVSMPRWKKGIPKYMFSHSAYYITLTLIPSPDLGLENLCFQRICLPMFDVVG